MRTALAAAAAAGLLLAGAGAATADDRGNHEANWKSHDVASGGEWGAAASGWATNQRYNFDTSRPGVSEGVHMAKGNGPAQ